MYANASNNTPYTHVSSYMAWTIHPPGLVFGLGIATSSIAKESKDRWCL